MTDKAVVYRATFVLMLCQ